jgi:hypothetical protein
MKPYDATSEDKRFSWFKWPLYRLHGAQQVGTLSGCFPAQLSSSGLSSMKLCFWSISCCIRLSRNCVIRITEGANPLKLDGDNVNHLQSSCISSEAAQIADKVARYYVIMCLLPTLLCLWDETSKFSTSLSQPSFPTVSPLKPVSFSYSQAPFRYLTIWNLTFS